MRSLLGRVRPAADGWAADSGKKRKVPQFGPLFLKLALEADKLKLWSAMADEIDA